MAEIERYYHKGYSKDYSNNYDQIFNKPKKGHKMKIKVGDTPIWVSEEGSSSGIAVVGHVIAEKEIMLITKEIL